jgi:hypothetical protein
MRIGLDGPHLAEIFPRRHEPGRAALYLQHLRYVQAGNEVSHSLAACPQPSVTRPTLAGVLGSWRSGSSPPKRLHHLGPGLYVPADDLTDPLRRRSLPTLTLHGPLPLHRGDWRLSRGEPARVQLPHPGPGHCRPGALQTGQGRDHLPQRYRELRDIIRHPWAWRS